uniref:FH2 domain containing 4 n=1 Tax=Astyanax mexicanus TaxID=7994 RepID=A0A8B9GZF4_ASTMX
KYVHTFRTTQKYPNSRRSSRMRNFNWEAIPQHTVLGKHNIWTVKKKIEYELDTKRMEELFSRDDQTDSKRQTSVRRSVKGPQSRGPKTQGPDVVIKVEVLIICTLQRKRGRRLPQTGRKKMQSGVVIISDPVQILLIQVLKFKALLGVVLFLRLLDCLDLHSVIRLVLKTGNYMNADGYAGSAVGFRMTSLLKLADTKANKPGMNLMHYVVMQAQKSDAALLKFTEQLTHIGEAARIHKQEIELDFQRKVSAVQEARRSAEKENDLAEQMKDFFQFAESRIEETKSSFQTLNAVTESVAEYFCEDPSEFKLDECCSIFYSFCERFKRAVQENLERDLAEVKRRQREKLQSAAKRRSTATCSMRDKDMEGVALESVLQRFLTNHGSNRRARTPSPTGNSLSEITSQENCPAKDDSRKINWSTNLSQASVDKENMEEMVDTTPKKTESKISSPSWKKKPEKAGFTPPGSRVLSVLVASEDEEGQTEEEVQKLREVSQKVLRYQSSRSSISSGEYLSPVNSPRKRTFQEDTDRILSASNVEEPPKPPVSPLVSMQKSPTSINRRHTIALPSRSSHAGSDSEEDVVIPNNPANGDTGGHVVFLGNIGKMKSVDGYFQKPSNKALPQPQRNVPENTPPDSSRNELKVVSSLVESRNKDVKEKTKEESLKEPQKQTKESSRFISFFRRLAERGKTNSRETESSSVDP